MKDSLRRPILFAVIVITGSLLILFDIPLTIMIPIILIVGFLILIILGAITITEIKTALATLKPTNLKKIGIIKKLDEMKFFEKKSTPVQKEKVQPVKPDAKQPVKASEKKRGIGLHLSSFVSSFKSLGTLLKERNKRGQNVEDINKQLDRTVREKVEKSSALASAGNVAGTSLPSPSGGAGTTTFSSTKDQDPFLSLSEDEFDLGLLDSLDDSTTSTPGISEGSPSSFPDATSLDINESEIPLPSLDIDGEAGNILKDNAQGLEEFSGLDGGDAFDTDFGDLDNLSLDDVDLEDETGEKFPQSSTTPQAPAPIPDVAQPEPDKSSIKTAWIKSDAPKDAGLADDQVSTQSDMAAFAGGGGSDADLLSSLASDVKHVKKEKNLSLLRELKDFKAPAADIETELNDMYTRMDAIKKTQKKETPPSEGIK